MKKTDIGIIGVYPPPIGGISIHISRLCNLLLKYGYLYHVYDIFSRASETIDYVSRVPSKHLIQWYLIYIFTTKDKIIHLHTTDIRVWLLFSIFILKKNHYLSTIHSVSIQGYISNTNVIMKLIITKIINRMDLFITVNEEERSSIISSLNQYGINPEKIKTYHAFLPPVITDDDLQTLPDNINIFKKGHYPIISANAFRLTFHNGFNLYGIDMCIELCNAVKELYPSIGMIICVSQIDNITNDYYDSLKYRISQLGLDDNILIFTNGVSFPPILKMSDIFVRPTNTDGDALSIREAIYFGIPAIASDVVKRPEGCITFKTRDINDFIKVTLEQIDKISKPGERHIISSKHNEELPAIIQLYKEILES